jgi:predicted hotdog family 3-hydroxylacyl-ACP dehydratase
MKLDRAAIAARVPQSGSMCLLDEVANWDDVLITCRADAPGARHPLARLGAVPSVAACEYAAQAAAVHGALIDGAASPREGMLVSLVDVHLHAQWFPPGSGDIAVQARLLSRTDNACRYAFDVATKDRPLAEGQLVVAFTVPGTR